MKFEKAADIAIEAAHESTMHHRMGAILYDKANYVTGFNRCFDCCVLSRKKPFSLHAEEMAILKGLRSGIKFDDSTLIVIRINRKNQLRCSVPCSVCSRIIERVGIKNVWHINERNEICQMDRP